MNRYKGASVYSLFYLAGLRFWVAGQIRDAANDLKRNETAVDYCPSALIHLRRSMRQEARRGRRYLLLGAIFLKAGGPVT